MSYANSDKNDVFYKLIQKKLICKCYKNVEFVWKKKNLLCHGEAVQNRVRTYLPKNIKKKLLSKNDWKYPAKISLINDGITYQ